MQVLTIQDTHHAFIYMTCALMRNDQCCETAPVSSKGFDGQFYSNIFTVRYDHTIITLKQFVVPIFMFLTKG